MAYSKGKISIPNVTGNIVITVTTSEQAPSNLFDKNDANVVLRARINSSGAAVAYADGQLVTGWMIDGTVGDTFSLTTDKALDTNNYTGGFAFYDSSNAHLKNCGMYDAFVTVAADKLSMTFTIPQVVNGTDITNTVKVRFCVPYSDIDNIVITKG